MDRGNGTDSLGRSRGNASRSRAPATYEHGGMGKTGGLACGNAVDQGNGDALFIEVAASRGCGIGTAEFVLLLGTGWSPLEEDGEIGEGGGEPRRVDGLND